MPKYVIERDLPGAGSLSAAELHTISVKSNQVLADMAPQAQWQHSYVTADKLRACTSPTTRPQSANTPSAAVSPPTS